MYSNLSALFIDVSRAQSEALQKALSPEVYIIDSTYSDSLSEGLNRLIENTVQICFIAETFPTEELQSFLRDITMIPEMRRCVVTLVKNDAPATLKRDSRLAEGIHSIISRLATPEDKQVLSEALDAVVIKSQLVDEKVSEVTGVLESLINQVDDVAMDRKRGVEAKYNQIVPQFIKDATNFDQEILESYYQNLSETLDQIDSPPEGFNRIEIPDKLLNGKFPKLKKDSYYGASRRLWKKLSGRWRKKEESEQSPAVEIPSDT